MHKYFENSMDFLSLRSFPIKYECVFIVWCADASYYAFHSMFYCQFQHFTHKLNTFFNV